MAKASKSGGGNWTLPAATTGKPETQAPKSKSSSSSSGASKHASTPCSNFSIASSLSSKNKGC
jgi:hypothetical protein